MKTTKIQIILIFLIALSYSLGLYGSVVTYNHTGKLYFLLMPFCIIAVNGQCGFILFKKAKEYKTEWMLFGLLANWNALLFYWLIPPINNAWSKGKPYFDK